MFDGLYFEYPKIFTFIIIYIACEAYCKIRAQAIYFPHVEKLTNETAQLSTLMWFLKWFGIIFLVLALMSPVRDEELVLEPEHGPDIVFVLQVNNVMQEVGFDTNNLSETRFVVIKKWMNRWIGRHTYSAYAFVVATDESYIASPLSMSTTALQTVLKQLPSSDFNGGVSDSVALQQALHVLAQSDSKRKIVVFIGDSSDIQVQWQRNSNHDAKLYSVVIVQKDKLTLNEKNSDANYMISSLDGLNSVYETINKKERLIIEKYDYSFKVYYYFYPLFLSFFSLLIYVYLRNRRGDV